MVLGTWKELPVAPYVLTILLLEHRGRYPTLLGQDVIISNFITMRVVLAIIY